MTFFSCCTVENCRLHAAVDGLVSIASACFYKM